MSKNYVRRLYFHLQEMVLCYTWGVQHKNSPSDLVDRHTTLRVCNSSAVENCYWVLLKLFVGSTVWKYSHQNNKIENMALTCEILHVSHVSLCDVWPLQILKVLSQTIQTIPSTIWMNIFIHKQKSTEFMDSNIWHAWTIYSYANCHLCKHGHRLQYEMQ